jgi:hypothetical protein
MKTEVNKKYLNNQKAIFITRGQNCILKETFIN